MLRPLKGQFDWAWTSDNAGSGVGFQRTWAVSDSSGAVGGWWSHDIYQTQMRVIADVCFADIDGNGQVDADDLTLVILSWGCTTPPGPCPADVNGSGVVDADDLVAVILAWGGCS